MTRIAEVCNREVVVIEPGESLTGAAKLMRDFHVGDLIVVERAGKSSRPVGILTDRDIVLAILAKEVALNTVAVRDVMSFELFTVDERDDLLDVLPRMRQRGVRRAPVINESGALTGILAADDVLELLTEELLELAKLIGREQAREQVARA